MNFLMQFFTLGNLVGLGSGVKEALGIATGQPGSVALVRPTAVTTEAFSKTSNTTLENVTGLSVNVTTGVKYRIEVYLPVATGTGAAYKVALGGTATFSILHVSAEHLDCTNKYSDTVENVAALGSAMAPTIKSSVTNWTCQIQGIAVANSTGTLTVQFAQDVSDGAASTVGVGAHLIITPLG